MIYFVIVVSMLGQAAQNGAMLELTGEAAGVEFGGALTLIHNSMEDELVCSGKIRASDVIIEGTTNTVADLIAKVGSLESEVAALKQFVGMMPSPPPAPPSLPPVSVTCQFTVDNDVIGVYFNNADITRTATGTLNNWGSTKQVSFVVPQGQTSVFALRGRDYGASKFGQYSRTENCAGFMIACQSDGSSAWGSLVSGINQGWKAAKGSTLASDWYHISYDDSQWSPAVAAVTRGCGGCMSSNGTLPVGIWADVADDPVAGRCLQNGDAAFRVAIHI